MKNVVSFSGGRTSAYLCHLMIEKFGTENVDIVYMDTGAEHPKTYEFIRKCVEHFGIELVCLQADFNQPLGKGHTYKIVDVKDLKQDLVNGPYAQMIKKYGTPGAASAWCTSRMKEETHDKYCNDKYGKGNYETWLGIRADEPKRLSGINKDNGIRYMAEISDYEKEDVLNWWGSQSFDLEIPEWLGNCVFCFKKSDLKISAAARDEPELYQDWLSMINEAIERPEQDRSSRHIMYRKKRRIEQVIATFDGSTGDEIKARMRGAKHLDTGSCSESCEVFS